MPEQIADISNFASDTSARIRLLEGKYNLLGERLLIINKNMIEEYKKIINHVKLMDSEIREMKKKIADIDEAVKGLPKEMGFFARKSDVKVLEKYINMWSPLNFVTREEVKKILKEKDE